MVNVLSRAPLEPLEGFTITVPPVSRRLIVSGWGLDKCGKTSLGLTFPAPRIYMNLDVGLSELFIMRPELVGTCLHKNYPLTEQHDPETWGPLLDQFEKDYVRAVAYADRHSGTVIVDTAAELWSVVGELLVNRVQQARVDKAESRSYDSDTARERALERADKGSRLDWQDANAYMAGLLRRVTHTENASAFFINRAREEYTSNGAPTGLFKFGGFSGTSAIVQAQIQLLKVGGEYYAQIEKCRFNGEVEGMRLQNPTYELLADVILGPPEEEA